LRALVLLRDSENYRAEAFREGIEQLGYKVHEQQFAPRRNDVLIIWNRTGSRHAIAKEFEKAGADVLVAENGYFGKQWQGRKWFALANSHHAGRGTWLSCGPERWASFDAPCEPWREGPETLIFEQRGIGEPGLASPERWAERMCAQVGGRIRRHPGASVPEVSLRDDLQNIGRCFTWSSGAAIIALHMGVPVYSAMPGWIAESACLPAYEHKSPPKCNDIDRQRMFERLAWAMWDSDEIRSGAAFSHLLGQKVIA
jgi:hypothetical protein